ncbi:hypothetical protein [Methanosarcina horonobensis]|uniref:hypothetical protein n=1 Tax=Methanosarcina horonobensis TaxID=418008 RepID=UPI000AD9134B|nr:hypothetical protein [Methanosarcina horonobensis]
MVKFAHLLMLSFLIVWTAGSGCLGNDSSDMEDGGITENVAEAGNADDLNMELLTLAEIQELDADMAELEILLDDASLRKK